MRSLLSLSLLLALTTLVPAAQTPKPGPSAEIEAFNRSLYQATLRMDNTAMLALWADDGISLLPSTKLLIGKPAIAAFFDQVAAQLAGARMEKFELQCSAIDVAASGDLASEWCTEHQIVTMPGGKPPFDGHGKMLLVLHQDTHHTWRIAREMWNQADAS